MAKEIRVFLGGTCNNSDWRDKLIPKLKIDFFNPVVPNWTEEAYKEELKQREQCDFCLYVITPKMKGVYSIAEVVDDSNKRPEKVVFHVIPNEGDNGFDKEQQKSLDKVGVMVEENGGTYIKSMDDLVKFLNSTRL